MAGERLSAPPAGGKTQDRQAKETRHQQRRAKKLDAWGPRQQLEELSELSVACSRSSARLCRLEAGGVLLAVEPEDRRQLGESGLSCNKRTTAHVRFCPLASIMSYLAASICYIPFCEGEATFPMGNLTRLFSDTKPSLLVNPKCLWSLRTSTMAVFCCYAYHGYFFIWPFWSLLLPIACGRHTCTTPRHNRSPLPSSAASSTQQPVSTHWWPSFNCWSGFLKSNKTQLKLYPLSSA